MQPCEHDLAERETACADGMCPLCLAAQVAEQANELENVEGLLSVKRRADAAEALLRCFMGDFDALDISDETYDSIEKRAQELRGVVKERDTLRAQNAALQERLNKAERDAARIDWIESIADKHDRIEIARSLLRGGYELGWFEKGGKPKCPVTVGSLRDAIDAALASGKPPEQTSGE